MTPVVIVLASGRGERFLASGGAGSKLQARIGTQSVLQHTLEAVRASGLPCHLEQADHSGMGDAIAAGVRATADAPAWLILPADLPLLRPTTLLQVAGALAGQAAAAPCYRGQRGHPVGFSGACGPALMALRGEQGARAILATQTVCEIEVDDPGCVTDIDTLDDLRRARLLWHARAAAPAHGRVRHGP